jgi:tetratricopeptide (TPR) repeat protein/predicted Ser/Thr protein kinase
MSTQHSERFKRMEPLLDRALDLDGVERERFLSMCADIHPDLIDDLRRALALGDDALPALGGLAAEVTRERPTDRRGLRAGSWRLIAKLGRGGMGTVYLAERADGAFEMKVAIKLLRGHDLRFKEQLERERRVLARLDHPHIARLLDGGVLPDGQPFLAMELADGEDLDDWLARTRPDLRTRLRVFLDVCEGVAYAHAVLVVHRDLKPSNIRVADDGQVKLLDFGIAKLLEPDAERGNTQHLALTPDFAAPEQLKGQEVSTRTDVYALGALLCMMLAGRAPHPSFDGDWASFVRRVTEDDAPAPSDVAFNGPAAALPPALLRGELDAIVAQALRRDPARRYPSVDALAADVRRYLEGRPVHALPAAWHYRSRKWLRRHWVTATAASAVVLALFAGMAGVLWQSRETAAERDAALLEARRSEAVRSALLLMFRDAAARAGGEELRVRELFDGRSALIESEFADDPATRQEVLASLGEIYLRIADYTGARTLLRRFLEIDANTSPLRLRAQVLTDLANAELRTGDVAAACAHVEDALRLLEAADSDVRGLRSDALGIRGQCERGAGRSEASIAAYRDSLALRIAVSGENARDTAPAHNNLGMAYYFAGRLDDARLQFERTLALFDANGQARSLDAGNVLNNLAALHMQQGELAAAERSFARAMAVQREVAGESAALGALLNNYGRLLTLLDRRTDARPLLDESLRLQMRYAGADSPDVAATLLSLGDLDLADGKLPEATAHYDESRRLFETRLGPSHLLSARAQLAVANRLALAGDAAASETLYGSALDALQQAGTAGRSFLATGRCRRAALRLERGELAPAAADAAACHTAQSALRPTTHYERIEADALLAAIEFRQGGTQPARARHRSAVAQLQTVLGATHPRVLAAAAWLAPTPRL